MPSLPVLLAWAVIVAVPVHWIAFLLLWRLSRASPANLVLRDRFIVAGFLAALVTVFGLVFLNNDIIPPPFPPFVTQIATRSMVLLALGPTLYWLWLYRKPTVDAAREEDQDTADAKRETIRDEADAAREVKRDEADAAREHERDERND